MDFTDPKVPGLPFGNHKVNAEYNRQSPVAFYQLISEGRMYKEKNICPIIKNLTLKKKTCR